MIEIPDDQAAALKAKAEAQGYTLASLELVAVSGCGECTGKGKRRMGFSRHLDACFSGVRKPGGRLHHRRASIHLFPAFASGWRDTEYMINRRTLLTDGVSGMLVGGLLSSVASAAGGTSKVIFTRDLPDIDLRNWSATVVEVTYGPGEASESHRHPGITIAYVLEGEIASKVGDGPEKVYGVGEMFMETPGPRG